MGNGKDGVGGRLCSSIPRPVNIGKAIKLSTGSAAAFYSIDTEQIGTKKKASTPVLFYPSINLERKPILEQMRTHHGCSHIITLLIEAKKIWGHQGSKNLIKSKVTCKTVTIFYRGLKSLTIFYWPFLYVERCERLSFCPGTTLGPDRSNRIHPLTFQLPWLITTLTPTQKMHHLKSSVANKKHSKLH